MITSMPFEQQLDVATLEQALNFTPVLEHRVSSLTGKDPAEYFLNNKERRSLGAFSGMGSFEMYERDLQRNEVPFGFGKFEKNLLFNNFFEESTHDSQCTN